MRLCDICGEKDANNQVFKYDLCGECGPVIVKAIETIKAKLVLSENSRILD